MQKATASQLIDRILEKLGVWGKYQIVQILIIFTTTWPSSNQLYSTIYMGYQPPLRCHEPENFTSSANASGVRPFYDTCKDLFEKSEYNTSCPNGYDYDNPKEATFVTMWDLVCDQSYVAQLAQTALVIGQAVGATLFTLIADRFGRMKACIISQWMMLAVSTGSIFSPTPEIYTFAKFLTGVAQQGHVTAFFVMPLEVLPTTSRAVPHVINSTIWSFFLCVQVAVAYFMREMSWRYFQLYMTLTSVVVLVPNMLGLDESIRWLFANQRVERLKKIIAKAIRQNKADADAVNAQVKACIDETDEELHAAVPDEDGAVVSSTTDSKDAEKQDTAKGDTAEKEKETEAKHKGTLLDIMKNRRLRITTFIMFFAWIVNSLTSFGLSLTASKLSGNRFLNYFLIAAVPIPAGIVSYYTLVKWGRKKTCMIFHAIAGLVLIAAVLLDTFIGESVSGAVTAFTVTGRFAISASWNTLFLYTPELYPTNLRSLGLGISSSSSRIGGMLAPFSNIVIDYIPWLPGTIYGCSCVVVCFLVLYLPETLNRELPQTLDEIKEWNNNTVVKSPKTSDDQVMEEKPPKSESSNGLNKTSGTKSAKVESSDGSPKTTGTELPEAENSNGSVNIPDIESTKL